MSCLVDISVLIRPLYLWMAVCFCFPHWMYNSVPVGGVEYWYACIQWNVQCSLYFVKHVCTWCKCLFSLLFLCDFSTILQKTRLTIFVTVLCLFSALLPNTVVKRILPNPYATFSVQVILCCTKMCLQNICECMIFLLFGQLSSLLFGQLIVCH